MDNVIDRTVYPLPQQKEEAQSKRRMGLGVTGMANALSVMKYRYGSEDYIQMQEHIMGIIRDAAYTSSVELSIEKGPFPLFDTKLLASEFAKTLPEGIREMIQKHGLRNSHLLSIAPTGTISLTANNVSSGIEPVFSTSYKRTIQTFEGPREALVEDYAMREWGHKCVTADELRVL